MFLIYRFHIDHIFPDSFFKKFELRKRGIDLVANLQLLEGLHNEEKLDKDFNVWLEKAFPNIDERNDYMKKHHIPQNIDLRFENFEEFFNKRNNLISQELR